jgi:hypothetical protein
MNPSSRFRRLIPRFSIGNLLMFMVIVGLCLAWYDQRRELGDQTEVIETQRREITRLTVENIMRSNLTDDGKAQALAPFIKVGDAAEEIEKWYHGSISVDVSGSQPRTIHQGGAGGLVVEFMNGSVSRFGYYTGQSWVQFVSLSDRGGIEKSP